MNKENEYHQIESKKILIPTIKYIHPTISAKMFIERARSKLVPPEIRLNIPNISRNVNLLLAIKPSWCSYIHVIIISLIENLFPIWRKRRC